ncbi:MAG: NAD(P)-dependent oxidoreductase [Betaproteobacteria bacterium]
MPAVLVEQLAQRFELLGPLRLPFTAAVANLPRSDAARVEALVTMGLSDTTRAAIATLPALRVICCLGSGYEGVDLAAARERGIAVTHSPNANAASVADLALTLLLASVRNLFESSAYLHSGDWEKNGRKRRGGRGLTGRRMGIYGLGAIGEKIAHRAAAFDIEVGYHNRNPRGDTRFQYFPTLLALATWADFLMISVRAGASTRHAVDAEILSALGRDGHVVNIARGSVIDEPALIEALRAGTIAGAGLDVFEQEPLVPAALRALPNVALTPHIGGDTVEAMAAMGAMVLVNLDAFFSGRAVPNPVPG